MENIFNNRHDVDEVDKVNMDDLYEKKHQSDLLKLKTYKMVLNRIHTRIKVTSRQNNNDQFCWFVIPEVILGAPKYDAPSCVVYVINELKENGFKVKYTHPNLLFISWKHYIPGYVRTEIKKQTGKSLDGFGNEIKKKNKQEDNMVGGLLINRGKKGTNPEVQKKDKEYKSIDSYKPTGKLIYNNELIQKVQDKFA